MRFTGILKRGFPGAATLIIFCAFPGCHSPYVNATIENKTGGAISPIEVDYPSASFGTEMLAAGATFKYRFKVLGNGGTKVVWSDKDHQEHTATGPTLNEGAEGTLDIAVSSTGASWKFALEH